MAPISSLTIGNTFVSSAVALLKKAIYLRDFPVVFVGCLTNVYLMISVAVYS
jgi:hypothetical protein